MSLAPLPCPLPGVPGRGSKSAVHSRFTHDPESYECSIAEPPTALGVLRIGRVPVRRLLFPCAAVDVRGFVVIRAAAQDGAVFVGGPFAGVAEQVVEAPA